MCYVTARASDSYEITGLEILSSYPEFPRAIFCYDSADFAVYSV